MTGSIINRFGVRAALVAGAALLLLMLAGPGVAQSHAAEGDEARASIVGGKPSSIAAYPWLASVEYRGPVDKFGCGGSVIAPRLILTAAHCVVTGTGKVGVASNFSVLTGASKLDEATPERISRVAQVLVDPGYDPQRTLNDTALLVLSAPVTAPTVAIATAADAALVAPGAQLSVAGWGLTEFEPPTSPNLMREAQLVVQDTSFCKRKLLPFLFSYSPASQFCVKTASSPGAGLCNGDSGGPGVAQRPDGSLVQVGVISLKGSLECSPDSPQVLARVDRASAWISAWIAAVEHGAPPPPVVVPEVALPSVTRGDAEVVIVLGLTADLGARFSKGVGHRIGCKRFDRTKIKCLIVWLRGAHLYRGGITVYTALPREGSIYNYRYKIRRFNARCWFTYRNPIQACGALTFTR